MSDNSHSNTPQSDISQSGNPHARRRFQARLSAIQALYQMDMSGVGVSQIEDEFAEHRFGPQDTDKPGMVDVAMFRDILTGVVREQDLIDARVSEFLSKTWSLARLDKTLRAIMRAGAYEIMYRPDVPANVVIDQYVTLAGQFFDDKERAFVNAALEKLAKKVRAAEFGLPRSILGHG